MTVFQTKFPSIKNVYKKIKYLIQPDFEALNKIFTLKSRYMKFNVRFN